MELLINNKKFVDYNSVFKQIDKECSFNYFQMFIVCLLYSDLKIKPTKEQFIIIKKVLDRHRYEKKGVNLANCDRLELYIIKGYGFDYLDSVYIDKEGGEKQYGPLILCFTQHFSDAQPLSNLQRQIHEFDFLEKNKSFFSNSYQLCSKIVNSIGLVLSNNIIELLISDFELLKEELGGLEESIEAIRNYEYGENDEDEDIEIIETTIEDDREIVYIILINIIKLLKTVILFFDKIGPQEIKERYGSKLIEMVDTISTNSDICTFYFRDTSDCGDNKVLLKVAELYKDTDTIVYHDIILKLFFIGLSHYNRIFKNKQDYETVLDAIYKYGENNEFLIKELIKLSKMTDEPTGSSLRKLKSFDILKNEESVFRPLIKSGHFTFAHFKCLFLSLIDGIIDQDIFRRIPVTVSLPVIQNLALNGDKYGMNEIGYRNLVDEILSVDTISRKNFFLIFQIDESLFTDNRLPLDELYLMEVYSLSINNFFECFYYGEIDLVDLLEILFSNLPTSPIKYQFIKSKLNQLIELLNINLIDRFILPNYGIECEQSSLYKYKSSWKLESIPSIHLPDYIIKEILSYLIIDESLFQILQISLLSRKYYEFISSLVNYSTFQPVVFNGEDIPNISNELSFIKSNLVYFKYQTLENTIREDPEDPNNLVENINSFDPLDDDWKHLISQFNSIEILDLTCDISVNDLNYFYWLPYLKKLTLGITTTNLLLINKYLVKLQEKGVQVLLFIYNNSNQPEGELERIKIHSSTIDISSYIDNQEYLHIAPLIQDSLELRIFNWNITSLKEFVEIKRFNDAYRLDKLRSLSLVFSNTQGQLKFNYLSNIICCFERAINLKEIKISFKINTYSNLSSVVEILFKLISRSRYFENVFKILIEESCMFQIGDHWSSINSYSFIQVENTFNSIQFIRNK